MPPRLPPPNASPAKETGVASLPNTTATPMELDITAVSDALQDVMHSIPGTQPDLSEDDSSETTPKHSHVTAEVTEEVAEEVAEEEKEDLTVRKPDRLFQTRYDWKIKLPKSSKQEADIVLRRELAAMYDALKAVDTRLVVYPWEDVNSKTAKSIELTQDIPTSVAALKKYFFKATPKPEGYILYVCVYLGHSVPFKQLKEEADWSIEKLEGAMYAKTLQVERSVTVGWLLMSIGGMDSAALTEAIFKICGVDTGIRWRIVSNGKWNPNIPKDEQIKALHIDIDAKTADEDSRTLFKLFSASRVSGFPLGIRLRLVPQFLTLSSRGGQVKAERLRNRQAVFCKNIIKQGQTWEIASLDYFDKTYQTSLRTLIMDIKSHEYPHLQLFHAVEKQYKYDGYNLYFLPKLENEARAMIAGLLTYLAFEAGPIHEEAVQKFFTPEAVNRAKTAYWDVLKRCVITVQDEVVEEMDGGTLDDDYFEFDLSTAESGPLAPPAEADPVVPAPTLDDDTVSTFASKKKPERSRSTTRQTARSPASTQKSTKSTVTTSSPQTDTTAETSNSRLSSMEKSYAGIRSDVSGIQTEVSALTTAIQHLVLMVKDQGTKTPPPYKPGSAHGTTESSAGGSNAAGEDH